MLNVDELRRTPLNRDPYDYVVVRDFIGPEAVERLNAAFPEVPGPGSHPPGMLKIRAPFKDLLEELEGPGFRHAVEEKFGVELEGKPTLYTVRGFCRGNDGKIHTDSDTKIITVLIYLNDRSWASDGGRLRILRNGSDLEDYVEEIEPAGGTLLVFRRSDRSWHGHHPYEGRRRAIQMNWVTSRAVARKESLRHSLSTLRKRVGL